MAAASVSASEGCYIGSQRPASEVRLGQGFASAPRKSVWRCKAGERELSGLGGRTLWPPRHHCKQPSKYFCKLGQHRNGSYFTHPNRDNCLGFFSAFFSITSEEIFSCFLTLLHNIFKTSQICIPRNGTVLFLFG